MKSNMGLNRYHERWNIFFGTIFVMILLLNVLALPSSLVKEPRESDTLVNAQEGDYAPDIRVSRSSTPTWSPLFGSLPSVDNYYSIDFGDVNNDGNLDLVVGGGQNPNSGGIYCWIGDGIGGWTNQSSGLPLSGWRPDIEVEDLNNDGKLDIVCGGEIYTGDGGAGGVMTWTFKNNLGSWNGVALGDVDNNGTIDIVAGTDNGIKVLTSNGGIGGTFIWTDSSKGLPATGSFWGVEIGDVNNDGKLDIAAAGHSGQGLRVYTGNGQSGSSASWTDSSGTGLPINGDYAQIRLGDANNDGNLDLAVARDPGGVRFFKGNGGYGGFTWIEESQGLSTAWDRNLGLSLGDVNFDGKLDIVAANYSGGGGVEVWLGDGGGSGAVTWLSSGEGLSSTTMAIDITLGDVNNDGRIDIGVTTETEGVQVWAGNLPDLDITGWLEASTNLPTSSEWYDVVFGDVNHDAKLDLAAASATDLGVKVYLGDGTGIWTEIVDPDLPSSGSFNGVRFADVNHDGNQDLIASNNINLGMCVWLGNGTGGFGPNTGPSDVSSPLGGVEVLDLNRDGDLDLISSYYNPGSNPIYLWNGTGDGNWEPVSSPQPALGYNDIGFGDVDHNGTFDLLASSHMNGFRFWLGDVNGGWSLQPQNGLPTTSSAPWIGGLGTELYDVNHDGNLDAILGGYNGNFGMRVFTGDGGAGGQVDWSNNSLGLPLIGQYGGVALGDLNHDGNLDILSANNALTSFGMTLLMGNGGAGGTLNWTDARLPNLPTAGNYWGAALGDVNSDGILDIALTSNTLGVRVFITQTRPSFMMELWEGWNLISLPLIQGDTSLNTVFESIIGDYSAVQVYDSQDKGSPWKDMNIFKPGELNELTEVNHTMGIFVYIEKSPGTTFTVFGDEIGSIQSIVLSPGWNLVGYPSLTDRNRTAGLNNINFGSDVDAIWTQDGQTKEWKQITGSDSFQVGKGYWVHSARTNDIVWQVPL